MIGTGAVSAKELQVPRIECGLEIRKRKKWEYCRLQ